MGGAVVETTGTTGSRPGTARMAVFPASDLAVIVTDDVFCDVVAHEHHGLRAEAFWPVVAAHKEYRAPAWLWVADRSGGPPEPPGLDRGRAGRPAWSTWHGHWRRRRSRASGTSAPACDEESGATSHEKRTTPRQNPGYKYGLDRRHDDALSGQ